MSYADYSQKAEDHQCFLILVRHVGNHLKSSAFNKIYDRISNVQNVTLKQQQRTIYMRYKRSYPLTNNDWGDFQAHRKVLGLICVGKCQSEADVEELYMSYHDTKNEYASSLLNSRLLLLGVDRNLASTNDSSHVNGLENASSHQECSPLNTNTTDNDNTDNESKEVDPHPPKPRALSHVDGQEKISVSRTSSSASTSSTGSIKDRSHVWFYRGVEDCEDLESRVRELTLSLFWVLESKRVDRSFEKKLVLMCAPFEKKDLMGVDTETRNYRRKCQGRFRKHLGDLCLLSGVPGEALLHYHTALETLKSANDWLWLAAAYEGLCSSSVIITYPQKQETGLRRNLSLSVKRGSNMIEKGSHPKSESLPYNGLDGVNRKNCLPADDIIERYKEAIVNYSKFKEAGIVEMEASIKATRVLITQKKYVQASDFLQNVVYINLDLSDEEKVQRYNTLSSLYKQVGFHRKSAFFKRVAAMQCVGPSNPKPAWITCYHLLLQALEGYRILLDPKEFPSGHNEGWPSLQLRVLHELTYSARRMGNPALAVRNLSFVLHTMHEHLSPTEKIDISNTLETYTAKCEGTPHPMAIENGPILPPVALTHLPEIKSFKLLELSYSMRPMRKGAKLSHNMRREASPFIYSPIVPNKVPKFANTQDFKWVEGDICEINIVVFNPMPYELKVSNIGLLTAGGVEFESHPANLTLPPDGSGPHLVKILGTPKNVGHLDVAGYTTHVLGVKSICKLKDIPHLKDTIKSVEVVPALPMLQVSTTVPRSRSLSNLFDSAIHSPNPSAIFKIYDGESHECQVTLSNMGKVPVTHINVYLDSNLDPDVQSQLFVWNMDNLTSQLPLQPAASACFTLYMFGVGDFIESEVTFDDCLHSQLDTTSHGRSLKGGPNTVPNILQKSMSDMFPLNASHNSAPSVLVEALLKFEYSGHHGLDMEWYRQCVVPLNLEILSSVVFNKWSITPGDSQNQCYINLETLNKTNHPMEVELRGMNTIILEEFASARVCIQMDRQDLPDIEISMDSDISSSQTVSPISKKISDYVDVSWKIPTMDKKGKASLEKLLWLPYHAGLFKVSPVYWDIYLNDELHVQNEAFHVDVGAVLEIDIHATNTSDKTLDRTVLSVECYQPCDEDSQTFTHLSDDAVMCVGCNKSDKAQISPKEKLTHACSLMLSYPGRYCLDIRCTSDSDSTGLEVWRHVPYVEIQADFIVSPNEL